MSNEFKYSILFLFVNDNVSIFSPDYYSYKYYYYHSIDDFLYDLQYDLSKDIHTCIEMKVIKNDK